MPRVVWKGAVAFGLVHVPVSLYPASTATRLDLDLIDRRDFAPVGYQRINKRTGEPVASEDIVKGYEYEKGQYVVVTDEDFREANVKATQTVEILSFVDRDAIPPYFYDAPYYLEPGRRGEKGYALLRETLRRSNRVGVASVVIRSRQHLAAVIPVDDVLLMNTLRFADEIRSRAELNLPGDDLAKLGVSERELDMAQLLVEGMVEEWSPEQYRDTYRDDLLARIERKIAAGKTHVLAEAETVEAPEGGAQVVDLMALLKRSLEGRPSKAAGAKTGGAKGSGTRADEGGEDSRDGEAERASVRRAVGKAKAAGASAAKPTAKSAAKSAATAGRKASPKGDDDGKRDGGGAAETRRRRA